MRRVTTWLLLALVPPLGASVIRLLGLTTRLRHERRESVEALRRQGRACLYAFWHSRQLMMPLAYGGRGIHVLISRHRDGELIQRIIARFGLRAVRGSTTRGGSEALRALVRVARGGADVAITPDGPKGPRQVAQPGVVQLAKASGVPIVPVTFACSKKNSSRAGIGFCSPCPSGAGSTFTATRFGWRPMRPMPSWSPSGSK